MGLESVSWGSGRFPDSEPVGVPSSAGEKRELVADDGWGGSGIEPVGNIGLDAFDAGAAVDTALSGGGVSDIGGMELRKGIRGSVVVVVDGTGVWIADGVAVGVKFNVKGFGVGLVEEGDAISTSCCIWPASCSALMFLSLKNIYPGAQNVVVLEKPTERPATTRTPMVLAPAASFLAFPAKIRCPPCFSVLWVVEGRCSTGLVQYFPPEWN